MNIIKHTRLYREPFRKINDSGLFRFVRISKKSLFSHSMMLCEWGLEEPIITNYMVSDDGPKEDTMDAADPSW